MTRVNLERSGCAGSIAIPVPISGLHSISHALLNSRIRSVHGCGAVTDLPRWVEQREKPVMWPGSVIRAAAAESGTMASGPATMTPSLSMFVSRVTHTCARPPGLGRPLPACGCMCSKGPCGGATHAFATAVAVFSAGIIEDTFGTSTRYSRVWQNKQSVPAR